MVSGRKRIADFPVPGRQSLRSIMGWECALWLDTRTQVARSNRRSGQIAAGRSCSSTSLRALICRAGLNASIKTRHWCPR